VRAGGIFEQPGKRTAIAHLELALLDDGHAGDPAVVVPNQLLQLLDVLEVDVVDDLQADPAPSVLVA
jgi:hypothetical protein